MGLTFNNRNTTYNDNFSNLYTVANRVHPGLDVLEAASSSVRSRKVHRKIKAPGGNNICSLPKTQIVSPQNIDFLRSSGYVIQSVKYLPKSEF